MGLIEIVIAAALLSLSILSLVSTYNTFISFAFSNQKNVEASYLLEEGLEAMTFLRDKSFTTNIKTLSTSTVYYLTFNGTYWATTTVPQYVDGIYLRSVGVSDVKRDASDKISASGTYDPNIKQVTATISFYQGHATTTKSISTYISNIYDN